MELKEQVELLQKDIAQLTQVMTEKAQKDLTSEVKELSDKLVEVQKELQEKKIQFAASQGSRTELSKKEVETRMDELFIAKHLCVNKETGAFDKAAYAKVVSLPAYTDAIKAFGDVYGVGATTQTGVDGLVDFVAPGFSTQLMEEIWLNLQVAGLFGRIQMPSATYTFPFAPGRIIAKAGLEGQTVNKTRVVDGKLTFTANKIMSIVELTDELESDALIPALNLLRKQLIDGFALAQDTMALNGAKTGANLYANTTPGTEDCRILVDGIRSHAMAGGVKFDVNTATNKYCGTESIRAVRALMGKWGVSPSDLALIVSIADYNKLLNEQNYQQLYSYGANSVILTGELGRIDNIPIIVSELIPQGVSVADAADAPAGLTTAGKHDATTTANNTKSTFVLANKSGFLFGDRKEFSLELWRNPLNQTTNLIGSQRLDFQKVTSAAGKPCGVGYNY